MEALEAHIISWGGVIRIYFQLLKKVIYKQPDRFRQNAIRLLIL